MLLCICVWGVGLDVGGGGVVKYVKPTVFLNLVFYRGWPNFRRNTSCEFTEDRCSALYIHRYFIMHIQLKLYQAVITWSHGGVRSQTGDMCQVLFLGKIRHGCPCSLLSPDTSFDQEQPAEYDIWKKYEQLINWKVALCATTLMNEIYLSFRLHPPGRICSSEPGETSHVHIYIYIYM